MAFDKRAVFGAPRDVREEGDSSENQPAEASIDRRIRQQHGAANESIRASSNRTNWKHLSALDV